MKPSRAKHGRFIIIEGGEGCGKDTQLDKLRSWASQEFGVETAVMFEPYDDLIVGSVIDALLAPSKYPGFIKALKQVIRTSGRVKSSPDFNPDFNDLDAWQKAMLFNAARREVSRKEKQLLAAGTWVFKSRSYISTLVYQGRAANMSPSDLERLKLLCDIGIAEAPTPDLVAILDVDPKIGLKRAASRVHDVHEQLPLAWHQQLRAGYLKEAELNDYKIIDANVDIDGVFNQLTTLVRKLHA